MRISAAVLAAILVFSNLHAEPRTWTNPEGDALEAEFLRVVDGEVKIRRVEDGREFSIPVGKLSVDDQLWVRTRLNPGLGVQTTPEFLPPLEAFEDTVIDMAPFRGRLAVALGTVRWGRDNLQMKSLGERPAQFALVTPMDLWPQDFQVLPNGVIAYLHDWTLVEWNVASGERITRAAFQPTDYGSARNAMEGKFPKDPRQLTRTPAGKYLVGMLGSEPQGMFQIDSFDPLKLSAVWGKDNSRSLCFPGMDPQRLYALNYEGNAIFIYDREPNGSLKRESRPYLYFPRFSPPGTTSLKMYPFSNDRAMIELACQVEGNAASEWTDCLVVLDRKLEGYSVIATRRRFTQISVEPLSGRIFVYDPDARGIYEMRLANRPN